MRTFATRYILVSVLLWLIGSSSFAQGVRAELSLSSDTMALGSVLYATLRISHPAETVIEFPTPRDFSPFEVLSTKPMATSTEDEISLDEIEYKIRTFSLSPKQVIALPYSWFSRSDTGSGVVFSDSLVLQRRVDQVLPELEYKYTNEPISLLDPPNFLRIMLLGLFIILLLTLFAFLLRKPIEKFVMMRTLKRNWERAQKGLARIGEEPNQEIQLESLNSLWRSYLDKNNDIQLGAMTTTELIAGVKKLNYLTLEDHQVLVKAANMRDQVLFAGVPVSGPEVKRLVIELARVFDSTFENRKEQYQSSR